ncbi:hypothetical protein F2Q69_00017390 [Brassica cretica]|uniref:Uncharacterized protein n=1 Tax=Brassica cretica TaxID=69181 RepID=A0A8S9R080_BRACR|nr:hypothetical protein F2Q69_00017390 [Brassica cretica]
MSRTGQRKSGDQDCPESGELRWSKKCSVAACTNLDENKIIWKKRGGFDPYIDFSCANIASKFTAKSTRQYGVHIPYDYDPLKKMHFCVRLVCEIFAVEFDAKSMNKGRFRKGILAQLQDLLKIASTKA